MITVHARRDKGYKSSVSRWKPRVVVCTSGLADGEQSECEHIVKYRHGAFGHAAAISEVICGELLEAGDIPVLQRRLVDVSTEFAISYSAPDVQIDYAVAPGLHFGTVHRFDVENGPPLSDARLATPQQLVDLWVFDTWLGNIDREVDGNTLLALASGSKFDVIAADQSDCFCGATVFGSSGWVETFLGRGLAQPASSRLTDAIMARDPFCFEAAFRRLKQAFSGISAALAAVPNEWWRDAKISPADVERALDERHQKVRGLFAPLLSGGLAQMLSGGYHVL